VQFRALYFDRLKSVMAKRVVVDLRNIYRPNDMLKHGFDYLAVGRPISGGVMALSRNWAGAARCRAQGVTNEDQISITAAYDTTARSE
jgi:hypothetical protein